MLFYWRMSANVTLAAKLKCIDRIGLSKSVIAFVRIVALINMEVFSIFYIIGGYDVPRKNACMHFKHNVWYGPINSKFNCMQIVLPQNSVQTLCLKDITQFMVLNSNSVGARFHFSLLMDCPFAREVNNGAALGYQVCLPLKHPQTVVWNRSSSATRDIYFWLDVEQQNDAEFFDDPLSWYAQYSQEERPATQSLNRSSDSMHMHTAQASAVLHSLVSGTTQWWNSTAAAASQWSLSSLSQSVTDHQLTLTHCKIRVLNRLAEGGYGVVYKAQGESDNQEYALKVLNCQTQEQILDAATELKILQLPLLQKHPNIVRLVDQCVITQDHVRWLTNQTKLPSFLHQYCYLFPLYRLGTAWDAIERYMRYTMTPYEDEGSLPFLTQPPWLPGKSGPDNVAPWPFPERIALTIVRGVASALKAMHALGYTHRDIKPHNILLSIRSEVEGAYDMFGNGAAPQVVPILMDLGSVAPAVVDVKSKQQALVLEEEAAKKTSPAFRPPELTSVPYDSWTLHGRTTRTTENIQITEKVDIWSLGCVMYALAFGLSPFESLKTGIQKLGILNGRFSIPEIKESPLPIQPLPHIQYTKTQFSTGYVDGCVAMLQLNDRMRPSADEVVALCERLIRQLNG